jgi:hypothetical protein
VVEMNATSGQGRNGMLLLFLSLLALLALPSCGNVVGSGETRIPIVKVLAVGTPLTDSVAYPDFNFYAAAVVPGAFYKVSITGLNDDADLLVFGDDGTYSVLADCSIDNTAVAGTVPEDCVLMARGGTLYFGVDGSYLAGAAGDYTIDAETVSTENLVLSTPLVDSIGRREARIYAVPGIGAGDYIVSITGLSDDADLSVFGNDASLGAPATCLVDNTRLVGTASEDCTLFSGAGTLYFVVDGLFSFAPTVSYTALAAPAVP